MIPTAAVSAQLGALLAADSTTLAPGVSANKIALVNAPFTPGPGLTYASLSYATFTGSAPKAGATGAQPVGVDPQTGTQVITIAPPAGGYLFKCTVAPGSPETIYGYALVDNGLTTLLGSALLPNGPITIQHVNDQINIDDPTMSIVPGAIF